MAEIFGASASGAIFCIAHLALFAASAGALGWTMRAKPPALGRAGYSRIAWKTALIYARFASGGLAAFSLFGVIQSYLELFAR